jgi:hypothetical protein
MKNRRVSGLRPGKMFVIVDTSHPGGKWVDGELYDSVNKADMVADAIRLKRSKAQWNRDNYTAGIQVIDAAYFTPAMEHFNSRLSSKSELPEELKENIENPPPSVLKLREEMMNKSKSATGRFAWAEGEQGRKDWEKWFAEQDQDFQDTWKEMNEKYKDVVKDQHKTADQNSDLLPVELARLAGANPAKRVASLVGTPAEGDLDKARDMLFSLSERLQKVYLTVHKHRNFQSLTPVLRKLSESHKALQDADSALAGLL